MTKDRFITTKYRVRPGVPTLIKFIEWKEIANNEDNYNRHILDNIVKEVLESLNSSSNLRIKKDKFKKRIARTLTFEQNTIERIEEKRKDLKCFKGEVIEICLYIYARKNLSVAEQKLNGIDTWDIEIQNLR